MTIWEILILTKTIYLYFLDNPLIDIVQYPTYLVENENKKILYKPKEQLLLGNEILKNWYKGNGLINYCVWNKIYRRAILNNIRFLEG